MAEAHTGEVSDFQVALPGGQRRKLTLMMGARNNIFWAAWLRRHRRKLTQAEGSDFLSYFDRVSPAEAYVRHEAGVFQRV